MIYKKSNLFISIVLSFLIGYLAKVSLFISEETPSSVFAEAICFYDSPSGIEDTSFSELKIHPDTNIGDAISRFSKTQRTIVSSFSKYGVSILKRNHFFYISFLNSNSTRRFPSGLSEGRKRLISFGILII